MQASKILILKLHKNYGAKPRKMVMEPSLSGISSMLLQKLRTF